MTERLIQEPSLEDNDLRLWLSREECYPVLYDVAKSVYSWAKREYIPRNVVDYDDNADPVQSIVGFVWEFLNSPTRLGNCRIQLGIFLNSGDLRRFHTELVKRIISFCLDERRKERNSPFHACYRRFTRVLSQRRGEVRYVYREEIGSYYAVSKESDLPFCLTGYLGSSGFGGWPHPGPTNNERDKAESLLRIAQVFWNRSLEELDKEHYLPILDLTRYVDAIYGLQHPEVLNSSSRDDTNQPQDKGEGSIALQAHDPFESAAAQLPKTLDPQYTQDLANAVEKLVDSWKPQMQMSFYLNYEREWTLAEIADYLKLNSPQSVQYHVKKVEGSLKEFFLQKEDFSGGDGEEEKRFVCELIFDFILKNHPECREQKKRSSHHHE